jgi:hypothetical protein
MMHTGGRHTKHDIQTGTLAHLSAAKDRDVLQRLRVVDRLAMAAEPPTDNITEQPIRKEQEPTKGQHRIALANEAARHGLCFASGQQSGALVALGERFEVRDNGLKQRLLHGTCASYGVGNKAFCRSVTA